MRYFMILCVVGLMAGCISVPDTRKFQNPETGEVVVCGPFETLLEESQCINKYRAQGYVDYHDTHTSEGYKLADPGEPIIRKAD